MTESKIIEPLRAHCIDVGMLTPDPHNARTHDDKNINAIAQSLKKYGQRTPLVVQRCDAGLVVRKGNGTLRAATDVLGWTEISAVVVEEDDTEATGYAIADNRAGELAAWDQPLLTSLLEDLMSETGTIESTGFTGDELDDLLQSIPDGAERVDPDVELSRSDELQGKYQTKLGQTWAIGRHTLMIGDCSDIEIPHGDLFFDPPWEMISTCRAPESKNVLAFCDGQRAADVIGRFGAPAWIFTWDCVSSWYTPNRPLRRGKYCLWYGDISEYDYDGSHYGDAGETRTVQNTRGSYEFVPDPRGKHLSDVFSQPITKLHSDSDHSHSKPIDWIRMLIANCTSRRVIDPYAGSGIAMAACEQIGRECLSVELCPKNAAIIIESMAQMGVEATLA